MVTIDEGWAGYTRHLMLRGTDDPKTLVGNRSDTVRRCDRHGVTHGNAATDTCIASLPNSEYQEAAKHLIMKPISQLQPLPKKNSRPAHY